MERRQCGGLVQSRYHLGQSEKMQNGELELYRKYRPTNLGEVIGQDDAVAIVRGYFKNNNLPHVVLLSGMSGVGKTTIARIIVSKLGLDLEGDPDFRELNCAKERGIDMVREIDLTMRAVPLRQGGVKIFLLDEIHQVTGAGQAALLKMLEDGMPDHVYFLLATTDANELLPTIITRAAPVKLKPIGNTDMVELLRFVLKQEGKTLAEPIIQAVVNAASGSARQALVTLQQIILLPASEQTACVVHEEAATIGVELARLLLRPSSRWPDVAKIIARLKDEPEHVRRVIRNYAGSILLNGKDEGRAYLMLATFDRPLGNDKNDLLMGCYEIYNRK